MAESATPVKLFGKWSLEDVEVSDLALVVSLGTFKFDGGFVELQHLCFVSLSGFPGHQGQARHLRCSHRRQIPEKVLQEG
jgi:hypothetical protein